MCRLLSVIGKEAQPLHRVLLTGDNSFAVQSLEHPDGWGIAYYRDGDPMVVRSVLPAICDELFEETSFAVRSRTVVAHVRRATFGKVAEANCHPFRYGRWVFAHNGAIPLWAQVRSNLIERIDPIRSTGIEGTTDSEAYFRLVMSKLSRLVDLTKENPAPDALCQAVRGAIQDVELLTRARDEPLRLTFVLTNGSMMMGGCHGKPLSVRVIEEPHGGVQQVMFSSEEIAATGIEARHDWREITEDEVVIVDPDLNLLRTSLQLR